MTLYSLLEKVENDTTMKGLTWFLDIADEYLNFTNFGEAFTPNIQADIVSQNESNYHFIQYKDDGHHCVTRPINSDIFLKAKEFSTARKIFEYSLPNIKEIKYDTDARKIINQIIYTCQQCIGCTLDALNNSNKAKKKNGSYFEILIRNTVKACGINIDDKDEVVLLPDSKETMKFEHDIILLNSENEEKAIGQLKTSSKDRIDKIFLDKYMYNKIKEVDIPHFAIFLNDVQRKENKNKALYGVNSTFLPGHFKAYTVALNPLDGVYYLDLRPAITKDAFLNEQIRTFDNFLVEDMWKFIK
ncbi:hypothetical protein HMPREF0860_2474 [Treponema socranskii subsp. socranskii VPI DR56BR1116 = ATCC 35536]|uniref:Uncharacterized protein n=2 Tax=Treponema socranskii TaxID=53419 RepID=U2LFI8_TRESO|nr:hypothetical protein HMPREF1325_0015 [Treponema socranskii subsp. socranskii VPI DR56BR1116 = ATCC 35536]ERK03253.1 hypothetical protein HMPREF0860_2474 [Treponema socranskii subsp. socranskii VPI DR56BR1116 = ATCC 35536]